MNNSTKNAPIFRPRYASLRDYEHRKRLAGFDELLEENGWKFGVKDRGLLRKVYAPDFQEFVRQPDLQFLDRALEGRSPKYLTFEDVERVIEYLRDQHRIPTHLDLYDQTVSLFNGDAEYYVETRDPVIALKLRERPEFEFRGGQISTAERSFAGTFTTTEEALEAFTQVIGTDPTEQIHGKRWVAPSPGTNAGPDNLTH